MFGLGSNSFCSLKKQQCNHGADDDEQCCPKLRKNTLYII